MESDNLKQELKKKVIENIQAKKLMPGALKMIDNNSECFCLMGIVADTIDPDGWYSQDKDNWYFSHSALEPQGFEFKPETLEKYGLPKNFNDIWWKFDNECTGIVILNYNKEQDKLRKIATDIFTRALEE